MEPVGPPLAKDAGRRRPLVCLGNHGDSMGEPRRGRLVSCPPAWVRSLAAQFRDRFPEGEVAINRPFPGGFTPMAHYWHRGIPWVAVELNRGLYEGPDGAIDGGAVGTQERVLGRARRGLGGRSRPGLAPRRGKEVVRPGGLCGGPRIATRIMVCGVIVSQSSRDRANDSWNSGVARHGAICSGRSQGMTSHASAGRNLFRRGPRHPNIHLVPPAPRP